MGSTKTVQIGLSHCGERGPSTTHGVHHKFAPRFCGDVKLKRVCIQSPEREPDQEIIWRPIDPGRIAESENDNCDADPWVDINISGNGCYAPFSVNGWGLSHSTPVVSKIEHAQPALYGEKRLRFSPLCERKLPCQI